MRLSSTRPQEVIDFGELSSELITMALMPRPHIGSGLVSAVLTYGYAAVPYVLCGEVRAYDC